MWYKLYIISSRKYYFYNSFSQGDISKKKITKSNLKEFIACIFY